MRDYKWSNQNRTERNAYPLGSGTPLSKKQKAAICQAAHKAAAKQKLEFGSSKEFEEWRRSEQADAVGKTSLTGCSQDDYKPLMAHFLALSGETGAAFDAQMMSQLEPKRVAFFKLGEACDQAGVAMAYAGAIARNRFKCGLNDCSPKQLWQLVFTVRNRKKGSRKAATAQGKAVAE